MIKNSKALTAVKELMELKQVSPELEARQEAALRGAVKEMRKWLSLEEAVRSGKCGRKPIAKPRAFYECYEEWGTGDMSAMMAASVCGVSVATWYKWCTDEQIKQEENRQGKHVKNDRI